MTADRYTELRTLAAEFHIEHIGVRGAYGLIQGPATDNVILRWYAINGVWSAETNALVAEHLQRGGTFIDIGANLGLTTIPAARLPGVRVESFEPDPVCFRHLTINVATNVPDAEVALHNVAAYDRPATVQLEVSTLNHGDNRIRATTEPGLLQEEQRQVVDVQAVRVDDVVRVDGPLVVKIDTQGAEPRVIDGARATLARAGLVCLEYWPYGMRRQGADPGVVHEWVRQFATVGVRTETGSVETLSCVDALARLAAIDAADPESYVDVIVRPGA